MKKNIFLFELLMWMNVSLPGQTLHFYGVNNKPLGDETNAITRIEIRPTVNDRFEIQTSVKIDNAWVIKSWERVKIKSDTEYLIREFSNGRLINRYVRFYSKGPDNTYNFVEMQNEAVRRKGATTEKIPLCLEAEVFEYYHNEAIRSKSLYHHNQLLSNENWLQNGDRYIDNIFYSVDIHPTYDIENTSLQGHLLNKLKKYNLADISGTILLGFVIMETGDLDGAYVVRGIEPVLDQVAVDALKSFPGKWKPAVLNNKIVRCYCTMPVNFKPDGRDIYFNYLEFSNGMLFY